MPMLIAGRDMQGIAGDYAFLGLVEFIWTIVGPGATRWWLVHRVCFLEMDILDQPTYLWNSICPPFVIFGCTYPRTAAMDGTKAVDWFGGLSILGLTVMVLLGLDFGSNLSLGFTQDHLPCRLWLSDVSSSSAARNAWQDWMQAFVGAEYYLPLYFQSAKEAAPFHSGLMVLPFVLTEAALSLAAGIIIHSTGRYLEVV
ncbi:hypothetical protein EYZ11_008876 [Aspergillus tanneri]|uniref:Uncharacterized protein n=1 Tax=Aspergillus tanneri TaxID=1220188 RepID=A0A4S3J9E4_9EURO|nr:hypothetical protein EYZ11_008876 [Aspergillus tanneri]